MKKLGRRARKRRHLQRTKQVASSYETPPGYLRTKTQLKFKYDYEFCSLNRLPSRLWEVESVVDFGRDGGSSVGSFRWRKNQALMADIGEALND